MDTAVWLLLLAALVAANLPWLSDRWFFLFTPPGGRKRAWMCWLEWLVMLALVGVLALGLERKFTGGLHEQDWEFYAVAACLFLVLALPGFIYRYELRPHLRRRRRRPPRPAA